MQMKKQMLQKHLKSKNEVDHRPTPDSYDLLAWSYLNMGQSKKH
jgi:hypothetical protein